MKLNENGRQRLNLYIFLSPWIIGLLVFTLYPIISSLFYSFTDYNIIDAPRFIGIRNYTDLMNDDLFFKSIKVTLYYTCLSVPIQLILSLALALLLNQKVPFMGFFRTSLYLPSMVSGVVMSLLWLWIFNSDFGLLNYLLSLAGIKGPMWLMDESWAIPALILMSLWLTGSGMVVFLAALQGVPVSLQEAAVLDGAGKWQQLRVITLPMISPIILFQLIMGIIDSFQTFTQAVVMTRNGGPHYATYFYVFNLYTNAFKNYKIGYASALGWLLLVTVMLLTYLIFKLSDKYVYYEGGQN
ncbi:carbohydrate ABC transporter permease [Ruminiclostridium cellobioparum]|uniref:ABC transporter, permease protein n=1 Tax=Ruminiclostridium cellobioparum subsp. termitidis CT1112 TaxID=1195236 RepID=S0FI32_RUMCE|nr:sugar ABC transporter permease [Ruminiclostridium cellobioparum]EMS71237.1 ABC transporter, permease protein [Ruminiclostridium cellobioparum subsp. termitidis CT1112]